MLFSNNKKTPHDAQQQLNDAQKILNTLQPALHKVYSNKAMLMMSKGVDWIEEYFYYIVALACFIFIFVMDSIFPFHLLGEIVNRPIFREHVSNANDISSFNVAVKGLVGLVGLLFILLGLKKRVIRNSKNLLHDAGLELKKVEKYFTDKVDTLSKLPPDNTDVNSTNPVT